MAAAKIVFHPGASEDYANVNKRFDPSSTLTRRLLSPEGAKILNDLEYGSPLKPVSYKLWYPEAGMSTAQYEKSMERWEKLLREIGRK